jgi:aminoglycoside phosphotransferase family enzyme/predicted kinase
MSQSGPLPLPLDPLVFGCEVKDLVTLHQTHIGWVYLVGRYAFKLKKPVKYDFLDFTTVEQRRWACDREVTLNRRLCPDLYIGLFPVKECGQRKWIEFSVAQTVNPQDSVVGSIVDWVIWMNRLPEDRMLDRLLQANAVTRADVESISSVLTPFYSRQRGSIAPGGLGDLDAVRVNVEENLHEGKDLDPALLSPVALSILSRAALGFLERNSALIGQRAKDGFVVDCHGDLRAENICLPLGSAPVLFDCIEFNDRFRICDSALDITYLAMDLASRGRDDLSSALLDAYRKGCDPNVPEKLLAFYLGYRAFVKAKVAAWIGSDKAVGEAQRTASCAQAVSLFGLSLRYALSREPILIVFCGPAGSGKSTLAAELSRRLGFPHHSSDILRDQVVPRGAAVKERYSSEATGAVYELLYQKAREQLKAQRPVVLDATFTKATLRRKVAEIAKENGARSVLIWAQSTPESIAGHLAERERSGQAFGSEAGAEVSQRQQAGFEPPTDREGFDSVIPIDTTSGLAPTNAKVWEAVLAALANPTT